MSDDSNQNGGRATVTMVYRAVDDLEKVMVANFQSVKGQLQGLSGIPERVSALETRVALIEASARREERRERWLSTTLPGILIGAGGVAVAAISLVFGG